MGTSDAFFVHPRSLFLGTLRLRYTLTGKQNSSTLIDSLAAKGVKRVLFQSAMSADPATLERCTQLGMEAKLGCPMMVLGGGFHRFHAFLAGVRR